MNKTFSTLLLPELLASDWDEAFKYTADMAPTPTYRHEGALPAITPHEVSWVIATAEGENDGPSWLCLGWFMREHRVVFFFLSAGCDYTGWDCQAGGSATWSYDLADLIRLGIPTEDRARLGIAEPVWEG